MNKIDSSRGDRYLSHSSRHTQVPVPLTNMTQSVATSSSIFHIVLGLNILGSQGCGPNMRYS